MTKLLPLVQCARVQSCQLTEKSCGQRWLNATPLEAEAQYVAPHLRVCIGCDDGKSRAHLGLRQKPREEDDYAHRVMARDAEWSNVSHLLKELHAISGLGPYEPFYDPRQLCRDLAAMESGWMELTEWRAAAEIRQRNRARERQEREVAERHRLWQEKLKQDEAQRQQHAPQYPTSTPVEPERITRRFFVAAVNPSNPPIGLVITWVGTLLSGQHKWACTLKIPLVPDQHFYVTQTVPAGLEPTGNGACALVAVEVINGSSACRFVQRDAAGNPQFLVKKETREPPKLR